MPGGHMFHLNPRQSQEGRAVRQDLADEGNNCGASISLEYAWSLVVRRKTVLCPLPGTPRVPFKLGGEPQKYIVTSAVDHSSVLNYCKALEIEDYRITYLPVDSEGLLNLADLENAITEDTAVVSLMWANNETGVLFPVKEKLGSD